MSRFSFSLLLCIISFSVPAYTQTATRWGSGIDFTQRAAKREQGRWSLSEWLEMKNRNKMMDSWLSTNAPSPFELMFGGSHNSYNLENSNTGAKSSAISYAAQLAAYAQFVGINAEYENNNEEGYNDLNGLLNIRLLGDSIQNTSFTIHYGQRTRTYSDNNGRLSQSLGQVSLQVYLTKYFGIDGFYRTYVPTTHPSLGDVSGEQSEAGLFIDFKALRIFGSWYNERQKQKIPAATDDTITNRTGIKSGIKIFF